MNIALLTQAVQGTSPSGGEATATPTGQFLELLSTLLGTSAKPSEELKEVTVQENTDLSKSIPTEKLSYELEQWLQQPDSLQWLKSLPQDAYRQFMDAYTGLMNQVNNETVAMEEAMDPVSTVTTTQVAASVILPLTKNERGTLPNEQSIQKPTDQVAKTVEENVRTIQQIVTQFKGDLNQTQKNIPIFKPVETTVPQVPKEVVDWMPKSMTWARPQIDADTVMYASKHSLPENLQARIEAALQRAPFKSGADGSKVLTVRLYPEQLGELVVKLERSNGELVVKLFASNQEAKQLLQSQMQQLQQTLQPLTQNLRVEISLTQQALESKTPTFDADQPEPEAEQYEQPKGETKDDDDSAEDE